MKQQLPSFDVMTRGLNLDFNFYSARTGYTYIRHSSISSMVGSPASPRQSNVWESPAMPEVNVLRKEQEAFQYLTDFYSSTTLTYLINLNRNLISASAISNQDSSGLFAVDSTNIKHSIQREEFKQFVLGIPDNVHENLTETFTNLSKILVNLKELKTHYREKDGLQYLPDFAFSILPPLLPKFLSHYVNGSRVNSVAKSKSTSSMDFTYHPQECFAKGPSTQTSSSAVTSSLISSAAVSEQPPEVPDVSDHTSTIAANVSNGNSQPQRTTTVEGLNQITFSKSSSQCSSKVSSDADYSYVAPKKLSRKKKNKVQKPPREAKKISSLSCTRCGATGTPEWRRGPGGARTFCNACGLFYRKLLHKVSAGDASIIFYSRDVTNSLLERTVPTLEVMRELISADEERIKE